MLLAELKWELDGFYWHAFVDVRRNFLSAPRFVSVFRAHGDGMYTIIYGRQHWQDLDAFEAQCVIDYIVQQPGFWRCLWNRINGQTE